VRARARLAIPHHKYLEVVSESMGLHRHDRYKELKIMQDADQVVADCSDLIAKHSLCQSAFKFGSDSLLMQFGVCVAL
jgi:hypothetical protein